MNKLTYGLYIRTVPAGNSSQHYSITNPIKTQYKRLINQHKCLMIFRGYYLGKKEGVTLHICLCLSECPGVNP